MSMVHKGGNAVSFRGDHHPVKVSTHRKSRNLFNQSHFNTEVNGITFSTDEDGTITVNGKPNSTGAFYYYRDLPAGTYTISVRFLNPLGSESNKHIGVRVRNKDNKQYVQLVDTGIDYASAQVENEAYQQLKIGIGISYDNYKLQIQFEEGPEATSFEPYGLIEEPIFEPIDQAQDGKTPTFENTYNDVAEVTVFGESTQETLSGRNLLQTGITPSKTTNGVTFARNDDGSVTVNGTATDTAYFNLDFNGDIDSAVNYWTGYIDREITVSGGNYGVEFTCGLFTEDIHIENICTSSSGNAITSTVPNYAYMMRCYLVVRSGTTVDNVTIYPQIELGSTATEYEPYCGGIPSPNPDYPQPIESIKSVELSSRNADGSKSAARTIDLQGHELRSLPDGTRDELLVHRDGTVELVQRVGVYDVDPDTGVIATNIDGVIKYFQQASPGTLVSGDTIIRAGNQLCTHFVEDNPYTIKSTCAWMFSQDVSNYTIFRALIPGFSTVEQYRAFFGHNDVRVIYKSRNPQTIQLPSIDPLPTYYPYTFVDGNGADISAHVKVFQ